MALLLKSVHILGSNRPPEERSDILIQGDKISAIGDFPTKKAEQVIDAQGAYCAPGFIDIDSTSDHYLSLFTDSGQEDLLKQGVTTIIGGQCGASLAPLLDGKLDSIRKWADTNKVNVGWRTIKEFLDYMDRLPLGVNFGTLAGHTTIRRSLMKGAVRDLSQNEIYTLVHIVENSLKEGAFGISLGLGSVHGQNTSYGEVEALAKIAAGRNGIFSAHLRNDGEHIPESIEEIKRAAEASGAKTIISHFIPVKGFDAEYKKGLELISEIPLEKNFYFTLPLAGERTVPLYDFLPQWAHGPLESMQRLVREPHSAEKILQDLPALKGEDLVVAEARHNSVFSGKSLRDIMDMYSISSAKKALLRLMSSVNLQAIVHYKNVSQKLLNEAVKNPHALIASHAPSFGNSKTFFKSSRSTSTFTEFLRLIDAEKIMGIEEAVQKMTALPARLLNLKGRGEIKEGNLADLVIFRGDKIKSVILNGKIAVEEGDTTGTLGGKILRHI